MQKFRKLNQKGMIILRLNPLVKEFTPGEQIATLIGFAGSDNKGLEGLEKDMKIT